jgi:hypothetical protein
VRLMDGRAESTELLNGERRRRAKLAWLSYETVFMSEAALAESWSLRRLAEGVSSGRRPHGATHASMPHHHQRLNEMQSQECVVFQLLSFREPGSLLLRRLEKRQSQFEYGLSVFMFHGLVR